MNAWALLLLGAFAALALRALIPLLWRRGAGGNVREADVDIGDTGSGDPRLEDIRVYIFEGPKFHRFRRWLTRWL